MNKAELKVQALREALRDRVAQITAEYEDRVADLRIEVTELSLQLNEVTAERDDLRKKVNGAEAVPEDTNAS